MQFKKIEIERIRYGDDRGKVRGSLAVEGRKADFVIHLSDRSANAVLKMCADEICVAAVEGANSFREEFIASINRATSASAGEGEEG